MDKRVFILGVAMISAGSLSWYYFNDNIPPAKPDMTQDEIDAYNQAEALDTGLIDISQVVTGLGFLLALISVGLKPRQKGGVGKPITQKPRES